MSRRCRLCPAPPRALLPKVSVRRARLQAHATPMVGVFEDLVAKAETWTADAKAPAQMAEQVKL